MKYRVCVVTGTRAEYGLLYWLMREIAADSELKLQIIATGTHLSRAFGSTYKLIERDGFIINKKVRLPVGDSEHDTIMAIGEGMNGISRAFADLRPDIVVLLGDRFEAFAAATAALTCRIPIAHIHGGETTQGAIDDAFRHAMTKMAHLHFVAAEPYRRRIIQMGEAPERVICVGAPGIEYIRKMTFLEKVELEKDIGFKFRAPTFLVTCHPVTLENKTSEKHIQELLSALDSFPDAGIIFTQANMDPDNLAIRRAMGEYVKRNSERAVYCTSLGQERYLSAMKYADVVVGNSSSGIIEAPAIGTPTVNIGDRQKGRLLANSVICCSCSRMPIKAAIERAISEKFRLGLCLINNPYVDKEMASVVIRQVLKNALKKGIPLAKEFNDLPFEMTPSMSGAIDNMRGRDR